MPDESRVKPQPLQSEERAHLLLMLRTRPDRCDPYTCGKAADEIEALATIEEARREQPVRVTDAFVAELRELADDTKYPWGLALAGIIDKYLAAAQKEGEE